MRKNPTLIATAAMIVFSTAVNAQVTVDVAKITCDQFAGFKITDPLNIAIWLNGYYSGKRDNTIVDPQAFKENYNKLNSYCIVNEKVTVLQAAHFHIKELHRAQFYVVLDILEPQ